MTSSRRFISLCSCPLCSVHSPDLWTGRFLRLLQSWLAAAHPPAAGRGGRLLRERQWVSSHELRPSSDPLNQTHSGQLLPHWRMMCFSQRASSPRSSGTSCWSSCSLTGGWRGGRRSCQVSLCLMSRLGTPACSGVNRLIFCFFSQTAAPVTWRRWLSALWEDTWTTTWQSRTSRRGRCRERAGRWRSDEHLVWSILTSLAELDCKRMTLLPHSNFISVTSSARDYQLGYSY